MISRIHCVFLLHGLLVTTVAESESSFPIDKSVGGEPFGHSVTDPMNIERIWAYYHMGW